MPTDPVHGSVDMPPVSVDMPPVKNMSGLRDYTSLVQRAWNGIKANLLPNPLLNHLHVTNEALRQADQLIQDSTPEQIEKNVKQLNDMGLDRLGSYVKDRSQSISRRGPSTP
jgi:hypothetical protein